MEWTLSWHSSLWLKLWNKNPNNENKCINSDIQTVRESGLLKSFEETLDGKMSVNPSTWSKISRNSTIMRQAVHNPELNVDHDGN